VDKNSNRNRVLSRPKDTSLEAYKAWMIEISRRLTTEKAGMKLTEEQWKANWKEYWKGRTSS